MKVVIILLTILLNLFMFTGLFAQEMPLVYDVENTGADWPAPYMPTIDELPTVEPLPDPFEWSDGRGRIENLSDWRYRRAEIKAQIEHYEIGEKPVRPDSITASYSDGTLTVNVTKNGQTLTLTSPVVLPAGTGPFPAVIGVGFGGTGSLPPDIFTSRNIATIAYSHNQVSTYGNPQNTDPYYQLYPNLNTTNTGQYSVWAWGVSRIIDGLELVQDILPIDLKHLAVTGCSYAGKLALFAGAFDERIALTIPQESGGGGYPAWRVSETLGNVETLGKTDHSWFKDDMFQFANAVSKLPHDHHELMAMVAPRALLVTGNPDYEWLADESGYVSSKAAKEVYTALGIPDRFGYSIIGGHGHCAVPENQIPEIEAFVEKFILGNNNADTDVSTSPYNTDLSPWINWSRPILSNDSSFLGRASLVYPANQQTQLDSAITFIWNQVENAETYYFQISTTPTFQTTVISDSITDTTRTVTDLSFAKKYYWRVQVKNSEGSLGPWSELRNFATYITLPSKTELVSVTRFARTADRIKLTWRKALNADEYSIQLSDGPSFTTLLFSVSTSDTAKQINGTIEGQTYYWRVAATNIGGPGPWSDVWNFTIIVAPTTLKLKKSGTNEITLTWVDHSDVEDGYVIERKMSPDTSFAVIDSLLGSVETYADTTVQDGHTYTYRIKAYKDSFESFYCDEVSLTLTDVQKKKEVPIEYSISQNYPNPFNPTTKIKFALPKTALTKILLYDLLGREIQTLINKEVKAGYHEISFDVHNLPGGVYFYRIQSGDFVQSKKMILMK